jgi:hypothetical protein
LQLSDELSKLSNEIQKDFLSSPIKKGKKTKRKGKKTRRTSRGRFGGRYTRRQRGGVNLESIKKIVDPRAKKKKIEQRRQYALDAADHREAERARSTTGVNPEAPGSE